MFVRKARLQVISSLAELNNARHKREIDYGVKKPEIRRQREVRQSSEDAKHAASLIDRVFPTESPKLVEDVGNQGDIKQGNDDQIRTGEVG